MSDLSHDAVEDGFHEIQLSGKQIVFLLMVLTVASAVIFLLGVLVGRDLRLEKVDAAGTAPIAASNPAPVVDSAAPPAEPPSPPTETPDELSYHKRLRGEKPPAEAVKPEPPPPAAKPDTPPPATRDAGTTGRAGAWIVQVGAFRDAGAARDVVKQLAAKGHPAFLVNPAAGMPVIYRVQVGAYNNRSEADEVARRIEKEDRFKPVVRQNR